MTDIFQKRQAKIPKSVANDVKHMGFKKSGQYDIDPNQHGSLARWADISELNDMVYKDRSLGFAAPFADSSRRFVPALQEQMLQTGPLSLAQQYNLQAPRIRLGTFAPGDMPTVPGSEGNYAYRSRK